MKIGSWPFAGCAPGHVTLLHETPARPSASNVQIKRKATTKAFSLPQIPIFVILRLGFKETAHGHHNRTRSDCRS